MQFSLTLPVPALVVAGKTEFDEDYDWCAVYTVAIMSGEIVVMERKFTDDTAMADLPFASDQDDAISKTLTALGERLRDLLS
jgi:hypothetical protein